MDRMKFVPLISDWQNIILSTRGIQRDYEADLIGAVGSKPIKIITGFRRSGKSFLVQRVARRLIDSGKYRKNNILYLNFEDFQLSEIRTIENLNVIVQMFLREMSEADEKFLIFDEIQKIKEWDRLIITLYEKEREVEIILTGSNSELLSSEIGSNLAGRFIELSILPFSFKEFLQYRGVSIKTEMDFYRNHSVILPYFTEYLKYGGLPEVFSIENERAKYSYIEGILSKVILDDIIERFSVRQVAIIEQILHYLQSGIGNIVSYSRVANFFKNAGVNIKKDTVTTYIDYIIKTFAIFSLDKFDWKLRQVFSGNKKYYSVDTGLVYLYRDIVGNYAHQLENIVYLKLKRDHRDIYYGALQSGKEIDFIVKEENNKFIKYQVAKTLNLENRKRELSSFVQSDKYMGKENNFLLTMDENEENIEFEGSFILQKNLIKWLLDV